MHLSSDSKNVYYIYLGFKRKVYNASVLGIHMIYFTDRDLVKLQIHMKMAT